MSNSKQAFDHLEERISNLIDHCQKLKQENERLKQMIADVESQRSHLVAKQTGAEDKVRRAIAQLEALGDLNDIA